MANFDKPILVMLPGIDGTGILLEPLADKLKDIFEVKIITYPKQHKTDDEVYFEVAQHVKQQLPQDKEFYLLGESFGGPLVAHLCADPKFSTKIKGAIFSATFIENPFFTPLTSIFKVINANISMKCLPDNLVSFVFNSQVFLGNEKINDLLMKSKEHVSDHTMRARVNSVLELESGEKNDFTKTYLNKLSNFDAPTIIFRGTKDILIPGYNSNLISSKFKNSKIIDIDASHLILETKTDEIAKIINDEFKIKKTKKNKP